VGRGKRKSPEEPEINEWETASTMKEWYLFCKSRSKGIRKVEVEVGKITEGMWY
jgi:hypothetical protein